MRVSRFIYTDTRHAEAFFSCPARGVSPCLAIATFSPTEFTLSKEKRIDSWSIHIRNPRESSLAGLTFFGICDICDY